MTEREPSVAEAVDERTGRIGRDGEVDERRVGGPVLNTFEGQVALCGVEVHHSALGGVNDVVGGVNAAMPEK